MIESVRKDKYITCVCAIIYNECVREFDDCIPTYLKLQTMNKNEAYDILASIVSFIFVMDFIHQRPLPLLPLPHLFLPVF